MWPICGLSLRDFADLPGDDRLRDLQRCVREPGPAPEGKNPWVSGEDFPKQNQSNENSVQLVGL